MVASGEQSKTFIKHNLSRLCYRKCENMYNQEEKSLCKSECIGVLENSQPSLKINEKLTEIAQNLRSESAELSSMADEIDHYNSTYII